MSRWFFEARALVYLAALGALVIFVGSQKTPYSANDINILIVAALLLCAAITGFFLKLIQRWSMRVFWEWIMLVGALLGGWILPQFLFPGLIGSLIGIILLCSPFLFRSREVRSVIFVLSVAGFALFFGSSLPAMPLWILWLGIALHDAFAHKAFNALRVWLGELATRRQVIACFPADGKIPITILTTHVVLPAALIAQVAQSGPGHAFILLIALLIGSWYAIMRSREGHPALIVPWAAMWMAGAEILIRVAVR